MHIEPKELVAGWPALEIRRFLRKADHSGWTRGFLSSVLQVSDREAGAILANLQSEGYVEEAGSFRGSRSWRRTRKGNQLALASAALRLTRATADRKIRELLERVRSVNRDQPFAYLVSQLGVFGSYLTSAPRLSDIDIAIQLRPKLGDSKEQHELFEQRISAGIAAGRGSTIASQLGWPEREVVLFLKARSRAYSFHLLDEVAEATGGLRVIFSGA